MCAFLRGFFYCWYFSLSHSTNSLIWSVSGDSFPLTAESHCEFGIQALGAIIFYLKRCQIDHQLLSMAHFSVYNVKDGFRDTTSKELQTVDIANRNMVSR